MCGVSWRREEVWIPLWLPYISMSDHLSPLHSPLPLPLPSFHYWCMSMKCMSLLREVSNSMYKDLEFFTAQWRWCQHGKQLYGLKKNAFKESASMRMLNVAVQLQTGGTVAAFALSCLLIPRMTHSHCCTYTSFHLQYIRKGAEVSWGWMWGINTAVSPSAVLSVWTVADGKPTLFCGLYLSAISFSHTHMYVHYTHWRCTECVWLGVCFHAALFI